MKAGDLLVHAVGNACIADTGYDAEHIRETLRFLGMRAVIGSHAKHRKRHRPNKDLYALRYLVEVFFHGLKRFRRLATRFEKTARNYLALIHVACMRMWLN